MALFALSGGHIVPAQAVELDGASVNEVLGALRERALDVVGVPLFPVVWERVEGDSKESHLITMDSAGNVVIVGIRSNFAAANLFEALSLAGKYSSMTRREIVAMYPGGEAAFEPAWQAFRESSPKPTPAGARMIVVTLRPADDLFPVITTLSEGVRVLEARVFGTGSQRYLSVETCHRRAVANRTEARPAGKRVPAHVHLDRSRPLDAGESSGADKPAEEAVSADKRRRRSRPRETHLEIPQRDRHASRSGAAHSTAVATPNETRSSRSREGGRSQRRHASLVPASPVSAASAPRTSSPAVAGSPATAGGDTSFDSSKIPVIPTWRLENEKERDTPNYMYAMRQQQVTRVRTEQLLWEKSAPKRESANGRTEAISESMAASASSDAVKRAAEREILSPAGRLLAIASRNRTPLSLSIEREGHSPASAKLTAWGTLIVGRASFTDPSQAASEALGGAEVDGWRAWTASDGRSLDDL